MAIQRAICGGGQSFRYQEALDCLNRATALDPANPLAKYERANVLEKMERLTDALAEYESLKV